MKRKLKQALGILWRKSATVRGPILRKIDRRADALITQAVKEQLVPVTNRLDHSASLAYETNLMLNSLVREVARLQMQIEVLQNVLDDATAEQSGLSIVADGEDGRAGERMLVG